MGDWDIFKPKPFVTGSGKGSDRTLGDKALFALGGADGIRTRFVDLPSGGRMMVKTRNGFPEYTLMAGPIKTLLPIGFEVSMLASATLSATMQTLYMTSGAYVFGPLGGINMAHPELTPDLLTYKSGTVAGVESAELVPLYTRLPPANGTASKIYNQARMPSGLNQPKLAMYNLRPSEFSGLMRRCMQARYGSGNTNYDMSLGGTGGITVGSSFGYTTGVLKFPQGYFLVGLESGGGGVNVTCWPLYFPQEYADLLVGSPTPAVETLALSHAYVDPGIVQTLATIAIAVGAPIAYGWNFSLTTNKAVCVVNDPLYYGYDRRTYSHMELTFTLTPVTYALECTYSLIEQVDGWIVPNKGPIWAPSGGETQWYNARASNPHPTTAQDFPVYAYYVGDTLKLVRWSWQENTLPAFDQAEWDDMVLAANFGASYYGEGGSQYKVTKAYGATITHGFSLNGSGVGHDTDTLKSRTVAITTDFEGSRISSPVDPYDIGFVTQGVYAALMGDDIYNNHNPYVYPGGLVLGDFPPNANPGNHWSVYNLAHLHIAGNVEDYVGGAVNISALVIPANDCCAAYTGLREFRSSGETFRASYSGAVAPGEAQEWYGDYVYDPIPNRAVWVLYGLFGLQVKRQVTPDMTGMRASGGTSTSGSSAEEYYSHTTQLHLSGAETVGTVDSEIFHPSLLLATLSSQVQVITSSLNTDARYHRGSLSAADLDTTSGYPTDITLFVGAS